MSEFLRELGYDPLWYWMFAGVAFVFWFASAIVPWNSAGRLTQRLNSPALFGALLLVAMFAWRWPAIFYYKPVNPDEAQFLSGALTTLARGTIWWIDPTTSGPLVILPLALPALAGWPVDYSSGRLIALLLAWGTVLFGYLVLRHFHGDSKGRLLAMPPACLTIFLLFWDFVPYCSEDSPLFFCALATWLCVTAFQSDGLVLSHWRLFAGGLAIGLVPFSKFQALPLGAAIGFSTVVWILRQPAVARKNIPRDLLCLIGGATAAFALMLVSLWQSGQWNDVYQSYVVHNLHYAQARGLPWNASGYILSYLTELSWGFTSFHYGMLLLLAVGLLGLHRATWRPLLLGWSLVVAAYCAVSVPGRLYPHYLLFLSLPLTLLVGLQFGYLLTGQSRRLRIGLTALFLCVGTGAQLVDRVWDRRSLHKLVRIADPRDRVVNFINQTKRPGDTLAVWGWRPELYVETQLPQATREALTEAQLNEQPQRNYYRARFMADLRASQPAFFVDSVGPADYQLRDRAVQGHETVPGLAQYIRQEYEAVGDAGIMRVYLRRDRLAASKAAQ
jgi:hypothetical protein